MWAAVVGQQLKCFSTPPLTDVFSRGRQWWGNRFKAQWRTMLTCGALAMLAIAIFVSFTSECPMLEKLSDK